MKPRIRGALCALSVMRMLTGAALGAAVVLLSGCFGLVEVGLNAAAAVATAEGTTALSCETSPAQAFVEKHGLTCADGPEGITLRGGLSCETSPAQAFIEKHGLTCADGTDGITLGAPA